MNRLQVCILTLLFISNLSFASKTVSFKGKVTKIKGQIYKKIPTGSAKVLVKLNDPIYKDEIVSTSKGSFVKIESEDGVTILLGENSKFVFKGADKEGKFEILTLLKGKLRAIIDETIKRDRELKFDFKSVSLGVRGTEFLASVYFVNGKEMVDVILLRGSLVVEVKRRGLKKYLFSLNSYHKFNSERVKEVATKAILKMKKDEIDYYDKNKENFYPFMMPDKQKDKQKGKQTDNSNLNAPQNTQERRDKNKPKLSGMVGSLKKAKKVYGIDYFSILIKYCVEKENMVIDTNSDKLTFQNLSECFSRLKKRCAKDEAEHLKETCAPYRSMLKRAEIIKHMEQGFK